MLHSSLYQMMHFVIAHRNAKAANVIANFSNVPLSVCDFSNVISRKDLALYAIILTLSEMNRTEIKAKVLKNAKVKEMMEAYPDGSNIFENFLNGHFEAFQQQMSAIEQHLQFDLMFGAHLKPEIFRKIRMLALRQYVLPYKIIDMRDIAKGFGCKLEDIE